MAGPTTRKKKRTKKSAGKRKGLTGAQLLKQGKGRTHQLEDIEGLDAPLYVKLSAADLLAFTELSAADVDEETGEEIEATQQENADRQNDLLAKCLCDEKGDAILTADQAEELAEMDWDIYQSIVRGVMSIINQKQKGVVGDDVTPLPDGESSPTS